MKINFRLHKKHTSITLKNDMVALWLLMNDFDEKEDNPEDLVNEFVLKCLDLWKLNVARGFSEFVYKNMYADILERRDFLKFQRIQEALP